MARLDVERSPRNEENDDAFMELFNDKDATFEDMVGAMREDDASGQEHQPSRRDAQSSLPQEMLGIDEEVKIKKVRKPVVKLDETRLTSAAGVPKLQRIAKTKMKFRGKGHEFSDVAMLLRTYQLWLHDLYPRAKFNDGLAIIEKLGHTKSLQRLRCGWINETKPNADGMNDSGEDNISETSRPDRRAADPGARQDNISPDANLDAGAKDDQDKTRSNAQTTGVDVSNEDPGFPGDDELDALLAEEPPQISMVQDRTSSNPAGLPPAPSTRAENFDDDFAHDEEIMRELAMWDD